MLNYRLYTDFLIHLTLLLTLSVTPPLQAASLTTPPVPVISMADGSIYPYQTIINSAQSVNVAIKMGVAADDVGKKAAIYIVAYTDHKWFMLDANNNWQVWNFPDMQALVPNINERTLSVEEQLDLAKQLKGFKGVGNIYVGYKVEGGEYRHALEPIAFTSFTRMLRNTGVNACANQDKTGLACPVSDYPGQDAEYATAVQSKYTKLDSSGNPVDFAATEWPCVKDNISGLWWEVKTTSGLQSRDNLYTWYHPDISNNGGSVGVFNGGSCVDSLCDTLAYTAAVNALKLCGYDNWRLPTQEELFSLVDNSRFAPAIDINYFPNTLSFDYWTSTPRAIGSNDAWSVYFYYGSISYGTNKNSRFRVRLVRDEQ